MPTVLHWFRRDLRLTDNTALHEASTTGAQVVPVYVLSTWKHHHGWTGSKRQEFLCGCLESLSKNLEAMDSKLIVRAGDAVEELEKLVRETGAEAIYFNRDPDPFGKAVESRLEKLCKRLGIRCCGYKDAVLHEHEEVLTGSSQPYKVYTPYSKNWLGLAKPQPMGKPRSLGPAAKVSSLRLPTLAHWGLKREADVELIEAGERAARDRLRHFITGGGLEGYSASRDKPAAHATSHLGADLRFGLISIRELYARCHEHAREHPAAAASVLTYTKELAWREFYMALLHFYPQVLEGAFNADFAGVEWPGSDEAFEAWKTGRTGFPIVDAGMRQLLATGFMHNRVRMIVAMFLTKDLHCHWMWGEQFFLQHLVDGEIASNNGGWQWSAGTGADAAPYFRIQNPWTQTQRYDPEGAYIKRWLPELKDVPAGNFMAPPKDGRPLVKGYPLPMVDHGEERAKTMALFAAGKQRR